jgi:hypothetical protein
MCLGLVPTLGGNVRLDGSELELLGVRLVGKFEQQKAPDS